MAFSHFTARKYVSRAVACIVDQLRGYRLSLFPQPFFGLFQRCRWKLYSGLMFATRTYVSFNKLPKSHRFAWVGHLAAAVMAACTVHSPLSHWPLTTHPEVPEANLHLQHVSDWQPACVLCMCAGCYSRHKMPQVLQVRTSHGRSRDTLSLDVVGSLDAFSCRAGSRRVAPGRAGSRLDLLVFALQELLEVSDSLFAEPGGPSPVRGLCPTHPCPPLPPLCAEACSRAPEGPETGIVLCNRMRMPKQTNIMHSDSDMTDKRLYPRSVRVSFQLSFDHENSV